MKINPPLILEIIWLITGTLSIVAGINNGLHHGWARFPVFLLMAAVCFVFAWIRDRQRKNR